MQLNNQSNSAKYIIDNVRYALKGAASWPIYAPTRFN